MFTRVTAYEEHLRRVADDAAYRTGFEHGLEGMEADSYPEDPPRRRRGVMGGAMESPRTGCIRAFPILVVITMSSVRSRRRVSVSP